MRGGEFFLQASHLRLELADLGTEGVVLGRFRAALLRRQALKRPTAPRGQMRSVQTLTAKQPSDHARARTLVCLLKNPQPILRGELAPGRLGDHPRIRSHSQSFASVPVAGSVSALIGLHLHALHQFQSAPVSQSRWQRGFQPQHLELERDSTYPIAVSRFFGRRFEANDVAERMKATKVYRGGKTQPTRTLETNDVEVDFKGSYKSAGVGEQFRERQVLTLVFPISSKGGGTTIAHVAIGQQDFGLLLDAMVRADRIEAMAAMSAELAKQLTTSK